MADYRFPVPVFRTTNEGLVCDYTADFSLFDRYILPLEGDFQGERVRLVSLFVDNSRNPESITASFGNRQVIIPPYVSGWTSILKASSVSFSCQSSVKVPLRISTSKEEYAWAMAGQDYPVFETDLPAGEDILAGDLVSYSGDSKVYWATESNGHALKNIRYFYNAEGTFDWHFGDLCPFNPMPDPVDTFEGGEGYPPTIYLYNDCMLFLSYLDDRILIHRADKRFEFTGYYHFPLEVSCKTYITAGSQYELGTMHLVYIDTTNVLHYVLLDKDLNILTDSTLQLPAPTDKWRVVNLIAINRPEYMVTLYDGLNFCYVRVAVTGNVVSFSTSLILIDTTTVNSEDKLWSGRIIFQPNTDNSTACFVYPKSVDGINKQLVYKAFKTTTDALVKDTVVLSDTPTTGSYINVRVARSHTLYGVYVSYTDTGSGELSVKTTATNFGAITTRFTVSKNPLATFFTADSLTSVNLDPSKYHGVIACNADTGGLVIRWYSSSYVFQSEDVLMPDPIDCTEEPFLRYMEKNPDWGLLISFYAIDLYSQVFVYEPSGSFIALDTNSSGAGPLAAPRTAWADDGAEFLPDYGPQMMLTGTIGSNSYLTLACRNSELRLPLGVAVNNSSSDENGVKKVKVKVDGLAKTRGYVFPPSSFDARVDKGQKVVLCGDVANLYGFI